MMMIKKYSSLFLAMLMLLSLVACVEKTPSETMPSEKKQENKEDNETSKALIKEELTYEMPKPIPDDDFDAFDQNLRNLGRLQENASYFGEEVLRANTALKGQNYVYSPLSTWLCYELFFGGTTGAVAADLKQHLENIPFADEEAKLETIQRLIAKYKDETSSIKLSNYLMIAKDLEFDKAYLDYAKPFFAGLYRMDLLQNPVGVTEEINTLIRKDSLDLIPKFYDEPIEPELLSILLNIVAMEVAWAEPFDPKETKEGSFTKEDGSKINVPMMEQTVDHDMYYMEDDYGRYLLKPYATGETMLFMLPNEGRTVEGILKHWQDEHYTPHQLEPREVHVKLPKFTLETTHPLKDLLMDLGLEKLFDPTYGNEMQGLIKDTNAFIGSSKQIAKIEVNEEGTKAAAVTDIGVEGVAMPEEQPRVELTFDRPFAFMIFDDFLELFRGVVHDPSQSE